MSNIVVDLAICVNELPHGGKRFDEVTHVVKTIDLVKITEHDKDVTNIIMTREIGKKPDSVLLCFDEDLGDDEKEELFELDYAPCGRFSSLGRKPIGELIVHFRVTMDSTKALEIYNGPVNLLDEKQCAYFVRTEYEFMCAMNHRMVQSDDVLDSVHRNYIGPPKTYPVVVFIWEDEGTYRYKYIDKHLAYVIDQAFLPTE